MNHKTRLLLIAALFVLVLPLMFTGNASAKYQSDGALQNGVTGGWIAPSDVVCVVGLHSDGTMDIDSTIHNDRDCEARLVSVTAVTSGDTLANVCGTGTKNTAGVKYAAPGSSTCVTIDGSGNITGAISMVNKDRSAVMCNLLGGQLANATPTTLSNGAVITTATKTVANGTAAMCIAYTKLYSGMNSNVYDAGYGQPLTFGPKGVDNTATPSSNYACTSAGVPSACCTGVGTGTCPNLGGFCYASMRTSIAVGSCPSTSTNPATAFGYSVSGGYCLYAYGTNGTVNANLTNPVTAAIVTGAGAAANLTGYTTNGDCLVNGGTWSNWVPVGPGATVGALSGITTAVTFDQTRQLVNADEGCLHCHSNVAQFNGDLYKLKDSYLLTGHKNMLRKVTPGLAWGGPNASGVLTPYTTDGTNAMTWGTLGTAGSALDGTNPMYYVYGDWMIMNPTVAIAGSAYGCANCHATGFSGGTAATPGVQSIGVPGYTGTQPADAGAGYVSAVKAGYKWDLEGIQCSRCHNAAGPGVTQAQINASSFPTTQPLTIGSGGMGGLNLTGIGINNLCFGCHQSIAKLWLAQGGSLAGTAQHDPTMIPTGVSHGAAVGRDFNGHVLGNSFLNSVHARYTGAQSGNGSITANSLGENDLTDPNGATEYNSVFNGYTCYQGSTSSDVAVTDASGNPLNTMTACNAVYGTGSWKVDVSGAQGTCTTCHDVHNSLFVASQQKAAIKKTCEDCHVNNATTGATAVPAAYGTQPPTVVLANTGHPQTAGTPFDTNRYESACVVCHMATQAEANGDQNTMPAHLWRINTSATYNTFPTAAQWNATDSTQDRNAQVQQETYTKADGTTGTYNNAVWVDLDMACGQCHKGDNGTVSPDLGTCSVNPTVNLTHAACTTASGTWTANVPPVFTKAELAAAAAVVHNSTNSTSPNSWCLTCHSTGVGGAPTITPGTNHHGVHAQCAWCHATPHQGLSPATSGETTTHTSDVTFAAGAGSNPFCMKCHGNTGSHGTHHVTAELLTAGLYCDTCHSVTLTASAGGEGFAGVTPATATNTQCLSCHSNDLGTSANPTGLAIGVITPGTNHHGVHAQCVWCHNETNASGTAGNGMITLSEGETSTHSASDATYSTGTGSNPFCMECHSNTGSHGVHHVTAEVATAGKGCTDCHSVLVGTPGSEGYAGITPVWASVTNAQCLGCHSSDMGTSTALTSAIDIAPIIDSGAGQNHHGSTQNCTVCHTKEPLIPLPATTNATCATCHAAEAANIKYAQMSTLNCTDCHVPGVLPKMTPTPSVCSNCHAGGGYDSDAVNMHLQNPTASFGVSKSGLNVNVDGSSSTCPSGATCSYDYNWGDGSAHGAAVTGTHPYAAGGTYTIMLTVSSSTSVSTATASQSVTLAQPDSAPVAAFAAGSPSLSGWTASVTDASTDPDGYSSTNPNAMSSATAISIVWGDGATTKCAQNATVSHTYATAGNYSIKLTATDNSGLSGTVTASPISVSLGTVTGTVTIGGLPASGAKVTITRVGGPNPYAYTNASGVYTISNVKPGAVTVTATQGTTTLGPKSVTVVSSTNTVNLP